MKKLLWIGVFLFMIFIGTASPSFAAKEEESVKITNQPNDVVYEERQTVSGTAKKGTEIEFSLINTSEDYKDKGNLVEGDKDITVGASERFVKEFKLKDGKNIITIKWTYKGKSAKKDLPVTLKDNSAKEKVNALKSIQEMINSLTQ